MFNLADFYEVENNKVKETYIESLTMIKKITKEIDAIKGKDKKEFYDFMKSIAHLIIEHTNLEENLGQDYFSSKTFDMLLAQNHQFYKEILEENYNTSYANPSYAVQIFGDKLGQLFSWFYSLYRNYRGFAFYHKIFKMEEYNQLFIKVYKYIINNDKLEYEPLKELMTSAIIKDKTVDLIYKFKEQFDPEFRFLQDIIENDNLNDLRYLFRTGDYISENEIKTARFLNGYSDEKLQKLAKTIVKAYIKGFEEDNKTHFLSKKSNIGLYYKIGLEKLYKHLITEFKNLELKTSIIAAYSTKPNEQYDFDHKFDNSLYLTEQYGDMIINSNEAALTNNKDMLAKYSGILYIEKFGDPLFSPEKKKEVLKLSSEQQELFQQINNKYYQLQDKFIPRAETSFCMVAFPTPKIGENFEKIFEETLKLNMVDSAHYEKIQQIMIDVFDQADYIHVKGRGKNQTDIKVKMQPIDNPNAQTNFLNIGASVNIPAGEVFTSPQLKETNGILHVEETYQNSLRYDNLKLIFQDGYITDYSCTNFQDEEENKKYIEENLLFPHKTLPIGEFAIGTNTRAYVVSKKYKIIDLLPILISEKTGPHFAIGDTCFSREEDKEVFNQFNKKAFCAKDNEKSRLRKSNLQEAYYNKHEDIVLAFDDIEFISAISKDKKVIDVIKDGKFVLEGTEDLNIPLYELD